MEEVYRQANRSRAPPKSFDLLGIGIIARRGSYLLFAPIYVKKVTFGAFSILDFVFSDEKYRLLRFVDCSFSNLLE